MPLELPDHSLIRLRARPETIYVSKGRTVLATGRDGFLDQGPDQGLFVHQTRLLSRYRYLIDGRQPQAVSVSNVAQHSWLGYYIAPPPKASAHHPIISEIAQETIELRLSRYVGEGLHEDVDLANFTQEDVRFTLQLELDADFADQDETRGNRRQDGKLTFTWDEGEEDPELRFYYEAHHQYDHQGEEGAASIRRGSEFAFRTQPRGHDTKIGASFSGSTSPLIRIGIVALTLFRWWTVAICNRSTGAGRSSREPMTMTARRKSS